MRRNGLNRSEVTIRLTVVLFLVATIWAAMATTDITHSQSCTVYYWVSCDPTPASSTPVYSYSTPVYYKSVAATSPSPSPSPTTSTDSSKTYNCVYFPYWWYDGEWHSKPTPSPGASASSDTQQKSTQKQATGYWVYTYTNTPTSNTKSDSSTPKPKKRPESSKTYSSVYYPFWYDGEWHSKPTPSPSPDTSNDSSS